MREEIKEEVEESDEDEELEKEARRARRRLANAAFRVCRLLATAFEGCGPEMSDMDAADFKDRASEIWATVREARAVIDQQIKKRQEVPK